MGLMLSLLRSLNPSKIIPSGASLKIALADRSMFPYGFQMPLHYPRYTREEYEQMPEQKVDMLLKEYGLIHKGTLQEKRAYAMGAFLWPDQLQA